MAQYVILCKIYLTDCNSTNLPLTRVVNTLPGGKLASTIPYLQTTPTITTHTFTIAAPSPPFLYSTTPSATTHLSRLRPARVHLCSATFSPPTHRTTYRAKCIQPFIMSSPAHFTPFQHDALVASCSNDPSLKPVVLCSALLHCPLSSRVVHRLPSHVHASWLLALSPLISSSFAPSNDYFPFLLALVQHNNNGACTYSTVPLFYDHFVPVPSCLTHSPTALLEQLL